MKPQDINELSQHLLNIATTAALMVGDTLSEAFVRGVSAEEKSGHYDLVTEYDREAERVIVEQIFREYPNSTVIGEEGGARGDGAVRWYVDPIDGTNNFATAFPFFCVSIGAALNGQMLAGVIYDPVRRELFSASTTGAFLNGERISARGNKIDSRAVLLTDFPYPGDMSSDEDYLSFAQMVRNFLSVRRLGCAALELAYVACGRADVAFSIGGSSAWDVAAGMLIVEQAGGRYVSLGQPDPQTGQTPWPSGKYIATCPEFELEQSILKTLVVPGTGG